MYDNLPYSSEFVPLILKVGQKVGQVNCCSHCYNCVLSHCPTIFSVFALSCVVLKKVLSFMLLVLQ